MPRRSSSPLWSVALALLVPACGGPMTPDLLATPDLAREAVNNGGDGGSDGAIQRIDASERIDAIQRIDAMQRVDAATSGDDAGSDETADSQPDGGAAASLDLGPTVVEVGATARVTATELNLRSGPNTTYAVLTVMPCGSLVDVLAGPTTDFWQVTYTPASGAAQTGWCSGKYLVADAVFSSDICDPAPSVPDGGVPFAVDQASIFDLAKLGVGYSYYWGHGSWRADGTKPGACMGSCPSCTHTDVYGADCSGFVAKVWQVPSASALTTDLHPYSTYNFYNAHPYWSAVSRDQIQPADALVYNANGEGHIMLFESGTDPWGSIWTYEARGCATGIVHNLRVAGTTYNTIRRDGL